VLSQAHTAMVTLLLYVVIAPFFVLLQCIQLFGYPAASMQ